MNSEVDDRDPWLHAIHRGGIKLDSKHGRVDEGDASKSYTVWKLRVESRTPVSSSVIEGLESMPRSTRVDFYRDGGLRDCYWIETSFRRIGL